MDRLSTRMEPRELGRSTECPICGQSFWPERALVTLWEGDKQLGFVCLGCIEADQMGAATRAQEAGRRQLAEALRDMDGSDWCTLVDYTQCLGASLPHVMKP